jgi:hypothetical protein
MTKHTDSLHQMGSHMANLLDISHGSTYEVFNYTLHFCEICADGFPTTHSTLEA